MLQLLPDTQSIECINQDKEHAILLFDEDEFSAYPEGICREKWPQKSEMKPGLTSLLKRDLLSQPLWNICKAKNCLGWARILRKILPVCPSAFLSLFLFFAYPFFIQS